VLFCAFFIAFSMNAPEPDESNIYTTTSVEEAPPGN
jgi:hypothetical protein